MQQFEFLKKAMESQQDVKKPNIKKLDALKLKILVIVRCVKRSLDP